MHGRYGRSAVIAADALYPFSAIVGQDALKLALIVNVVDPRIGGVLLTGEKGTAKSTAVRALAALLPSTGVVELPLSATEDRVVGTLDIERALSTGEKRFEPGILHRAHGNILYVDEVNLLEDHLVDLLLDVAAMGVNYIEREGVTHSHPCRFVLVGTMNPEEGDLRPQLSDRFALSVPIRGESDPKERAEVVRRRLDFEEDPIGFVGQWAAEESSLRARIEAARTILSDVEVPDDVIETTTGIAVELEVDGHRADINMVKTARALAAFRARSSIASTDLGDAARLVLPHRLRSDPFDDDAGRLDTVLERFRSDV